MQTMTFIVPGAHCGSCRADIERAIRALPGATSATVDLRATTLIVDFDEAVLDRAAIMNALRNVGYPARTDDRDIDRNGPIEPM